MVNFPAEVARKRFLQDGSGVRRVHHDMMLEALATDMPQGVEPGLDVISRGNTAPGAKPHTATPPSENIPNVPDHPAHHAILVGVGNPWTHHAEHAPRLISMMLGGEDFALETGSIPGDETLELPKRLVAFAAQAHDVAMFGILGTVADYSDKEAYRKSAERARRFGFSGGTCVHPALVSALNEAFAPTANEVAEARKLIQADAEAAAAGRGSFQVDGKMIDIPVIERARRLLARQEAIERRAARR